MNKKAQSFYTIMQYIFVRISFILVLVAVFVYVSGSLDTNALTSNDVRKQVIQNRLFYSQNSITYVDPDTGRVYPHIVDLGKFETVQLDKAFYTKENNILAGRIDLTDTQTNTTHTAYINEDKYESWKHYTKFDQYDNFIEKKAVLIKDQGNLYQGAIKLNFVIPNE